MLAVSPSRKEILRGCKFDKISGSVCYPEDEEEEKVTCFYRYSYGSGIVILQIRLYISGRYNIQNMKNDLNCLLSCLLFINIDLNHINIM